MLSEILPPGGFNFALGWDGRNQGMRTAKALDVFKHVDLEWI